MNYWAVMAMKARFFICGFKTKRSGRICRKKVIDGVGEQFKLSQPENFTNKDYIASSLNTCFLCVSKITI